VVLTASFVSTRAQTASQNQRAAGLQTTSPLNRQLQNRRPSGLHTATDLQWREIIANFAIRK
jgi:hypothetical protein